MKVCFQIYHHFHLLKLIDLRQNYKSLNYSTVDVDMQIYKVATYPLILVIMTILSSIIMLNTKKTNSKVIKDNNWSIFFSNNLLYKQLF